MQQAKFVKYSSIKKFVINENSLKHRHSKLKKELSSLNIYVSYIYNSFDFKTFNLIEIYYVYYVSILI